MLSELESHYCYPSQCLYKTIGFCFNDGRQHEIKKSVFAIIIPQSYMCSRVFPTRVRGRLLGEKCIILLQCWPLIAPLCPQTPFFAPFHVHDSIRNLWGFKCTLSPPRTHQQLVYIPLPYLFFFIMISSCIHQGKGRWAMTQSSFQSSTMAIRPWWHVQWWVRRWEWDSFSYAQVQLVGTTSIQTMLHNTLWVGANVIVVPKFQNVQSVDNNVLSNRCKVVNLGHKIICASAMDQDKTSHIYNSTTYGKGGWTLTQSPSQISKIANHWQQHGTVIHMHKCNRLRQYGSELH